MDKDLEKREFVIDVSDMPYRELNREVKKIINKNLNNLDLYGKQISQKGLPGGTRHKYQKAHMHEKDAQNQKEHISIVLKNVIGQRYIGDGVLGDVSISIYGTPGNDLAAFMDGPEIEVFGNGQDGIGNTMNSGRIIIHGDCGDIAGYSMRGGQIYIKGNVGWRSGIHMKSYLEKFPVIVIGGRAGNFLGEYMAGGIIIVLGLGNNDFNNTPAKQSPVGDYTGTGMHGGAIFIRGDVEEYKLGKEVRKIFPDESDKLILEEYTDNFCRYFNIEKSTFTDKDFKDFIKLTPYSHRPYGKLYAY
jgi:glutamate synthase domain-containing protein 3